MNTFIWDQKYVTGHAMVDAQHQTLVGLINAFADALAGEAASDRSKVDATFMALSVYARDHFAEEERLMQEAGLDQRFQGKHQRQHRGFIANVTEMHQSLREGLLPGDEPGRGLMRFLVHWLSSHILHIDHQMARQLARVASGVGAAEAFDIEAGVGEAQPSDEGSSLLSGALHELLRALGERNRQLAEANGELERRVVERTVDLETKNKELLATISELKAIQGKLVEASKLVAVGELARGLANEIRRELEHLGPTFEAVAHAHERLRALIDIYQRAEPLIRDATILAELASARQQADLVTYAQHLPRAVNEVDQALTRIQSAVRDLEALSRPEGAADPDGD